MQIFSSLPKILAPSPDAPLAGSSVSELCLETCVTIFGRDVLLAELPNDDSLVVLYSSDENRKRMDLATIIVNALMM
jgi:hypothetical protein